MTSRSPLTISKIPEPFARTLQFDQRAGADGFVGVKHTRDQRRKLFTRPGGFQHLPGLAVREVGGLQAARVVLVFGFALLIGGVGLGDAGRFFVAEQFGVQVGDDLRDDG